MITSTDIHALKIKLYNLRDSNREISKSLEKHEEIHPDLMNWDPELSIKLDH